MPVEMTTFELPGGTPCLRMETSGHFSKEDADVVVRETNPGGAYYLMPQLVLTQKQTSIASEARSLFAARGEQGEKEPWVAVVVSGPVIRVVTNFLVRINRNKRVCLFNGEPEALRWLDARTREQAAKTGAP
jgi:hypothetical protein